MTLYELCTSQRPFTGSSTEEVFGALLKGRYQPLRRLQPGVPRRLANAIERCLKKDPRRRYQSAIELANELEVCAGKYLEGFHPQSRLVALLRNRGLATQEEALIHVTEADLLKTHDIDLVIDIDSGFTRAPVSAPAPRRRWVAWVVFLGLLSVAGAAGAVSLGYLPSPGLWLNR